MASCRWRALLVALVAVGLAAAVPAVAVDAPEWTVGVGAFGVDSDDETVALAELEYRFEPLRWRLFPLVGIAATPEGTAYVRAGTGRRFRLGRGWMATLSLSVVGYEPGDGPDLGGALQFRSALDIGYEIGPTIRIGLGVAHLSNAGLDDDNPGVETLGITVSYRLDRDD